MKGKKKERVADRKVKEVGKGWLIGGMIDEKGKKKTLMRNKLEGRRNGKG
jgi:hypothetical protein